VAAGGGDGRRWKWPAVGSVGDPGLYAVQIVEEKHASSWVSCDAWAGGSSWSEKWVRVGGGHARV